MAIEASRGLVLELNSDVQNIHVSHKLETNYEFHDQEGMEDEIKHVILSCQVIVKTENIEGLAARICSKETSMDFALKMEKVECPSDELYF
jgi:hypothetical protein